MRAKAMTFRPSRNQRSVQPRQMSPRIRGLVQTRTGKPQSLPWRPLVCRPGGTNPDRDRLKRPRSGRRK